MKIIPNIYLLDGKCVSLYKGKESEQKRVYFKEPFHTARLFESEGAKTLQVTDLNASKTGSLYHLAVIKKICGGVDAEVQLAGGIRTMEEIDKAFKLGVSRVVLGVSAIHVLKEAVAKYGSDKIVFGIKARQHKVDTDLTIDGKEPEISALAKEVEKIGITQIIYKDLETEGTLYHPNFDEIEKLVNETEGRMAIYSSGGIADDYDIKLLKDAGAAGVIISRAFMEDVLDLRGLVERFE
ncbi:MAG: 1-(5-phosphoribosyl)-5-[(5-phosphoribosylamino)methylideneamino] imidazole-4-carboxamide isomerase [Candidatus Gracilibacteria bacterium]|jgi:phosphoribosylformimino-5-aminoimidazole carboxamide ribotide isomerase